MEILKIHKISLKEAVINDIFQETRLLTTYKKIIFTIIANTNSGFLGSLSFKNLFKVREFFLSLFDSSFKLITVF